MASQILSGTTNASYSNNTGQNVRVIINYMENCTSMTWAGVTVTGDSETIGKSLSGKVFDIYGELDTASSVVSSSEVVTSQTRIRRNQLQSPAVRAALAGKTLVKDKRGNVISVSTPATTVTTSDSIFIPREMVERGNEYPIELMLAPGDAFSAICGAYNIIAIKEDGT